MTESTGLPEIDALLERLHVDGGRYLLSVGLTNAERDAMPEPTFGGKGFRRWLTDGEYDGLCTIAAVVKDAERWRRVRKWGVLNKGRPLDCRFVFNEEADSIIDAAISAGNEP